MSEIKQGLLNPGFWVSAVIVTLFLGPLPPIIYLLFLLATRRLLIAQAAGAGAAIAILGSIIIVNLMGGL